MRFLAPALLALNLIVWSVAVVPLHSNERAPASPRWQYAFLTAPGAGLVTICYAELAGCRPQKVAHSERFHERPVDVAATATAHRDLVAAAFARLGQDGWELVISEGHGYYGFRRQVREN